jgi:hypothetical protein
VAHDELVRFWREVNVADVVAGLQPDRYEVTFFRPRPGPHSWDGMAVVWFEDEARGRAVTEGLPEPARRNGFAELLGDVVRFEADEHTFFDRPAPAPAAAPVELTFLVAPRPGASHQDVVRHWVDVHGPAVAAPMAAIPGARRYVATPAHAPAGGYSGVTQLTYDDRAASAAHASALVEDGFSALADNGIYLVGERLVVRWDVVR